MPDLEPLAMRYHPVGGRVLFLGLQNPAWNKGGLRVAVGIRFFLCFPTFGCIDEQLCVFMESF